MNPPLKPLKWYKNLSTRKGRLEANAFIIEGERAVSQVITSRPDQVIELVSISEPLAQYAPFPVRTIDEKQFKSISNAGTPQGILAVVRAPESIYSDTLPENPGSRILLLEDVQDPGNTGTLIRTAAAFGYDGIIMTDNCADPLSPKCVQSTAGSILSVWIRRTEGYLRLIDELKEKGYHLAATVLNGTKNPEALNKHEKLILALGNEASGLSESITARANTITGIPMDENNAESLNVAACGAICLYLSIRK